MKLSSRFEEALVYAAQAHAGQMRKGTSIPYVSHPLAVAALALEHGATEDEAIGALLHDVVEDAGGEKRLRDVRLRFGDQVAAIVAGCSDSFETPKPPWRERKEAYLRHLSEATSSVLLVSCCDKLHNARSTVMELQSCGEEFWNRFRGGKEGTLWYYRGLLRIFERSAVPRRLVDELATCVRQMHAMSGIHE